MDVRYEELERRVLDVEIESARNLARAVAAEEELKSQKSGLMGALAKYPVLSALAMLLGTTTIGTVGVIVDSELERCTLAANYVMDEATNKTLSKEASVAAERVFLEQLAECARDWI